jgi:hypothetical protein
MTQNEEKLRKNIYSELKRVTKSNSPFIHAGIQTPNGYAEIEKRIIEKVIRECMPVQAILPHIENEISAN